MIKLPVSFSHGKGMDATFVQSGYVCTFFHVEYCQKLKQNNRPVHYGIATIDTLKEAQELP